MREKNSSVSNFKVVMIILVMAACLIVPVWQSSLSVRLEKLIALENTKLIQIDEKKLALNAQIAKQSTPEYIIAMSSMKGIPYNQLSSVSSSNVASNI